MVTAAQQRHDVFKYVAACACMLVEVGAEAGKGNSTAIRSSTMGGGMGSGVRTATLTACAKRLGEHVVADSEHAHAVCGDYVRLVRFVRLVRRREKFGAG